MRSTRTRTSVTAAMLALLAGGSAMAQGQLVGWGGSAGSVPVGSMLRFTDIAGGERHTVALRADGTVQAWGLNTSGQVTVPAGLAGVVQVAAGFNHTAVVKGDGTVQCWGLNDWGQSTVPSGLSGVVQVSAGFRHTVAVKSDGTAAAWGHYLQTGVPANLAGVRHAAAGQYHTLVARSDGTVTGWGSNGSGQLTIPAGLAGVSKVAAGSTHSVALRSVGTVAAWGGGGNGQLDVPVGLSGVVQIAAFGTSLDGYSIALKSDGTVVAWGYGGAGQLSVPAGLAQVSRIAAGRLHGLSLKRDGSIAGWGYAGDGQLSTPSDVRGVIQASAGNEHALAVQSDGRVVAWGKNDYGQSVVPSDLTGVVQVAAGARHSVALTSAGVLRSWGSNDSGQQNLSGATGVSQIAAGTAHTVALFSDGQLQSRGLSAYDTPPTGLSGVTAIACGGLFTVTRKSDGTVVAWGVNTAGQCLGTSANGTAITTAATGQAVKILGTTLQGVTQIAAGYSHAVALRSNGTVVGWGDNAYGQCSTPAGLVGVTGIAVGSTNSHTMAIGPGGSVHAWGRNDSGQCNVPANLTGVTQVSAGNNCSIALLPSGLGSCGNTAGSGSAALSVSGSAWQNVGIWTWSNGVGPQIPGSFTNVDLGTYGSVGSDCSARALTLVTRSGTSLLVPAAASALGNDYSIRVGNAANLAGRLWLLGVSGGASTLPANLDLPVLSAGTVNGNFDLIQSDVPPPEGFFLTLVPESVNGRTVLSLRLLPLPGSAELSGASAGTFTGTAVAAETIDIDHDGFDDLALAVSFGAGQPGLIQILLNDGLGNLGGTSVLETIPAQPTCLAVGDVNGDGRKDVVAGLASDSTARVYLDDGSTGLSPGTVISGIGGTPTSVIVIPPAGAALRVGGASVGVGLSGNKLKIYLDSTLQQEITLAGTVETVRGGNTGGAGGTDIVTGGSKSASINMLPVLETGFVQVLRRQSSGQYAIVQSMYLTAKPVGMDVADLDGDGLDDIVTANADPQLPAAGSALPVLSIFRNTGGTFGGGVPYQPQGASSGLDVSLIDADADGDRDIVSVHRKVATDSEAALLRVDTLGAGTPISIGQTTVLDANDPILAARGDLDGIGGDDLYLVDTGGSYLTGGPQAKPYLGMPGMRQGDLDGDGVVGPADIGLLLLDYGPCSGCTSDLDGNGEVDGGDLSFLLLLFD